MAPFGQTNNRETELTGGPSPPSRRTRAAARRAEVGEMSAYRMTLPEQVPLLEPMPEPLQESSPAEMLAPLSEPELECIVKTPNGPSFRKPLSETNANIDGPGTQSSLGTKMRGGAKGKQTEKSEEGQEFTNSEGQGSGTRTLAMPDNIDFVDLAIRTGQDSFTIDDCGALDFVAMINDEEKFELASEDGYDATPGVKPYVSPFSAGDLIGGGPIEAIPVQSEDGSAQDSTQDKVHQQLDAPFDFGEVEASEHIAPPAPQPVQRSRNERVSEAIQRLEALFEPTPSSDKMVEEGSAIQDILCRTPLRETLEDPLNIVSQSRDRDVPVENTTTTPIGTSQTAGQPQIQSSESAVATKARPTTRRSSVQALTRVSSQAMTLTPTKGDAASKVKQRSAITALHTPPPLAKSNRPTTKANFQLPGDRIAAKLKSQREERLKKEAEEEQKRREFKAKPVAKPTKPVEVKTTAASRARMSLAGNVGAENMFSTVRQSVAGGTIKRASMANTRSSLANNNGSSRFPANSSASTSTRLSSLSKPATSAAPTAKLTTGEEKALAPPAKRTSTIRAASNPTQPQAAKSAGPRKSVLETANAPPIPPQARRPMVPKGKQVVNRDKLEKEEKDKALQAKMDATKKARAEAAERGRVMSREWAEKKKAAALGQQEKILALGEEASAGIGNRSGAGDVGERAPTALGEV